jgi:microsomal dipeptidase-like Zn-dependent dipeptidase
MYHREFFFLATAALALAGSGGCQDADVRPPPSTAGLYGIANGCFSIDAAAKGQASGSLLVAREDAGRFELGGRTFAHASRLFVEPADLGTYLLRDADGYFVVGAEDGSLARLAALESDVTLGEDGYVSPAEWDVLVIDGEPERFQLRQRATGRYLGTSRLEDDVARAARVAFYETDGCTEFPELGLDASGSVSRTEFDDGTLFGIVDAHSHLFTNHAFGGGGVFHGAPFHRLGVEHALSSCEDAHGFEGRKDIVGYFFGSGEFTIESAQSALLLGNIGMFDHYTDGYPEFTDWPNAWGSATHQTQYHRWLERAYLGGLRLIVQHATSNQVLCELTQGVGSQRPTLSCNEMVAVERMIDETRALERYIDAQHGGPGHGWFRVVETPAEARQVIGAGKLAVILGIETSNLFDCFLTPPEGMEKCDEDTVRERLDHIRARGVRAIFPVHKYDNAFSAGDGHRGFIEFGNFVNSGHYSNFTSVDCPDVPAPFDRGAVSFGGLNQPRDVYDAAAPLDMSGFAGSPLNTLFPYVGLIEQPAIPGDHCQNAGLQPLGELLIVEMMRRGMILEVDHLPRRSYARAYELLHDADYPAAGTHGSDNHGDLYTLSGISTLGLDRCEDSDDPQAPMNRLRSRIDSIADAGAYPAQGFGFDFNGFAGGPRPRFGDDSSCSSPQSSPLSYPFTSFAGDVTFEPPRLGNRDVDFDTEGMIHIGLLPELIEDARNVGYTDADLEPIFRSAEGYIRMWERAEERGAALLAEDAL